jgi:hypothetical protein
MSIAFEKNITKKLQKRQIPVRKSCYRTEKFRWFLDEILFMTIDTPRQTCYNVYKKQDGENDGSKHNQCSDGGCNP